MITVYDESGTPYEMQEVDARLAVRKQGGTARFFLTPPLQESVSVEELRQLVKNTQEMASMLTKYQAQISFTTSKLQVSIVAIEKELVDLRKRTEVGVNVPVRHVEIKEAELAEIKEKLEIVRTYKQEDDND